MSLEISILAGLGGSGERLYSQHPLSLRPAWCTNRNDQGYTEKSRLKKKYFITGNLRERVRSSWLVGGHLWKHSAIELLVWDLFIRLMAETRLRGEGNELVSPVGLPLQGPGAFLLSVSSSGIASRQDCQRTRKQEAEHLLVFLPPLGLTHNWCCGDFCSTGLFLPSHPLLPKG